MHIFLMTSAPVLLALSSKPTLFIILCGTGAAPSTFSSFHGSICTHPWRECKGRGRCPSLSAVCVSCLARQLAYWYARVLMACAHLSGLCGLTQPILALSKCLSCLAGHSNRPVLVHIFQKVSSHWQLQRGGRQSSPSSFLVYFPSAWMWQLLSSLLTSVPFESFLTSIIS